MVSLEALESQAHQLIQNELPLELGYTWLRKRLHVDYFTACHLMDRLEQAGAIGPATEQRLREVLCVTSTLSIFD